MKRFAVILMALCLMLGMVSCVGNSDNGGEDSNGGNNGNDHANAFYFTYEGTKVKLHAEASAVIAALGEPKSYTEEPSCAFDDGMDKTYTYDSFIIQTYPLNGKDYVFCFWFVDDLVENNEGIRIGQSEDKVKATYGEGAYNGSNAYTVKKDDGEMTIIIKDGVVYSIQYAVVL